MAGEWASAADFWTDRGCPYEAALARAGSTDEGALRQALSDLQHLGAQATAALVARRLRELGATGLPRGPRPATRSNTARLTARELDVLALLSQGLRNAEIAARLYLSPKTVEHHVTAVLAKLHAHNRAEAIAAAARLGLIDSAPSE